MQRVVITKTFDGTFRQVLKGETAQLVPSGDYRPDGSEDFYVVADKDGKRLTSYKSGNYTDFIKEINSDLDNAEDL